MQKRQSSCPLDQKRLLSAQEAAEYVSMGTTTFRQWAAGIGAVKRFGKSVRYDKRVIDRELDRMGTSEG